MTIRTLITGSGITTMLQSCQANKADERAHTQRWREAVQAQAPDAQAIELHSAPPEDVQAMLSELHRVVVDTHTRPDGGTELVGIYLRDPDRPLAVPRLLHLGAALVPAVQAPAETPPETPPPADTPPPPGKST